MKRAKNDLSWWGITLSAYFGWRVWLLLIEYFALLFVPLRFGYGYLAREQFLEHLPQWLVAWGNFDGMVFMRIGRGGYGNAEAAFFPLLPIFINLIHRFDIPYAVAGLMVTTIAFLLALPVLHALVKIDGLARQWWLFLALLFLFPTSHYYTAIYQDSLYLLFASGTILLARQKRFAAASLVACLAMLTRLNAMALFAYLWVEYMFPTGKAFFSIKIMEYWQAIQRVFSPAWWRKNARVLWFFVIPLVFIGFLVYLDFKFGTWQVFFTSVNVWHRDHLIFPLQTVWRYVKILLLYPTLNFAYWVAWGEFLFTCLYGLIALWGLGKMRFSYWVLFCAHFFIPMSTGTLQGMPRYGLHLYPLFLALTAWLVRVPKPIRYSVIAIFAVLQVVYAALFLQGYFVA